MTILLFLMVVWVALTGEITLENVGFSFFLAALLLFIASRGMNIRYFQRPSSRTRFYRRFWLYAQFATFFLIELVKASLDVFVSILQPNRLRPGVVAVPLDLTTDNEITLLANLITLTPGTLSLDVSTDKKVIYVHTIRMDDADSFRRSIKQGFEMRVMEVMRL